MAASTISQPMANNSADGSRLLKLPGELRTMIYRRIVVDTEPIQVDTDGFQVPGLLLTCKEVRDEALKIFYIENIFEIITNDYDFRAYFAFKKVLQALLNHGACISTDGRAEFFTAHLNPNWTNLLEWMRLYHEDTTAREVIEPSGQPDANSRLLVIGGMFAIIKSSKEKEWGELEELLQEFRVILAAIDARWNQ